MTDMVKVKHLKKNFGDLEVLKDISLTVKEREKLVIIGPSGSGKSTFIWCINYLKESTSGKITVSGTEVTRKNHLEMARRYSSMVFQQLNFYPHLTMAENLTLAPMGPQHIPGEQAVADAMKRLERVGLRDKTGNHPVQLSGGQQQRVTIARAPCTKQPLILFDEPTSTLDPETVQEVLNVMVELMDENITMICVTHEVGFVRQVADRVVFMDGSYILEEGTPEHFFETPEHERAKAFLNKILH